MYFRLENYSSIIKVCSTKLIKFHSRRTSMRQAVLNARQLLNLIHIYSKQNKLPRKSWIWFLISSEQKYYYIQKVDFWVWLYTKNCAVQKWRNKCVIVCLETSEINLSLRIITLQQIKRCTYSGTYKNKWEARFDNRFTAKANCELALQTSKQDLFLVLIKSIFGHNLDRWLACFILIARHNKDRKWKKNEKLIEKFVKLISFAI